MSTQYATRMGTVPKSFIREILKVTEDPQVISFAGGLPNPRFFPVSRIAASVSDVLAGADAPAALQYSATEGYRPLREYIAARYRENKGLEISADEILITNGSQQGLDLVGKAFVNKGDSVAIERPGYLGAIQALSVYEPRFHAVSLMEDGIDVDCLRRVLTKHQVRLLHTVINFQNPSGISYSRARREELAGLLRPRDTVVVEDDPYGELRFEGTPAPSMRTWLEDRTILLGSFSKIVAPGLRLGWVCARSEVMEKISVAKQAGDLHSNTLCQMVLHHYLTNNDLDSHIAEITTVYRRQRDAIVAAVEECFPEEVRFTRPAGGMFLWVTLPESLSALKLFEYAIKENVAFVPGTPFFIDGSGDHNIRLNFSNADENMIEEGIRRLGQTMKMLLAGKTCTIQGSEETRSE